MPHRQLPPDLAAVLIQQVQDARRSAQQQQPLVINVGEGGNMTLILGGSATTNVYQIKP